MYWMHEPSELAFARRRASPFESATKTFRTTDQSDGSAVRPASPAALEYVCHWSRKVPMWIMWWLMKRKPRSAAFIRPGDVRLILGT